MISTITLDTYKQQIGSGDAFNLSDSFNGRVGDEQVPLVVQFQERGLAQQFQDGLVPFLSGFVGSLDENDQVTAETGEAVSYVGTSDDIVGLGRVKMNLPGTMFPQEGYFYGFLGLQTADGSKRITTFNVWFHVYNGNPDMFVNKAPFRTELQKVIDAFNDLLTSSKGTFSTSMNDWKQQVTALLTDLNGDYAKVQTTVNLIQQQLTTLEGQIKSDGLMTQADLNTAMAPLQAAVDNSKQSVTSLQTATTELQQNALMINPANDFNKASLLFNVQRRSSVGDAVAQTMQRDVTDGSVYVAEQKDTAGSQTIVKYDGTTKKVLQERSLNLDAVVWFEGNSLYHDRVTNDAMFVLPADAAGNWFIYNFDKDTKSDTFKMSGQVKYCIDDSGQYFVTIDSKGMPGYNDYVTGFNFYDLNSVINMQPKLVNYIPVNDGLVRGANKIQGFQMVGDFIYIGRGKSAGWFRTTVVDMNGAVTADYVWDKNDIRKILGYPDNTIFNCESEGMSWNIIDGKNIPVIVFLNQSGSDVYYGMINLNDPNGTKIGYTSGVTVAGITRKDMSGVNRGLAFSLGSTAQDPSILDCLKNVHSNGSYNFTVSEGNSGLAPEMGSVNGIAMVREMDGYNLNKMMVIAVDYDSCVWTNYFDKGTWMQWAKSDSHVPLWRGSSDLTDAVTLNKPVTPYTRFGILYQTQGGQEAIAYGNRSGIAINNLNNDGSAAETVFYETDVSFPTDDTAIVSGGSVISLAANTSGNAIVSRKDGSTINILEIWGMM
ncbi:hypothetical protein [Lactiplantibacillus argentoratensis]|uniref:hypothetical protein n=1 Tax=Lactiplantibacillus argentoratensis TaxID=271881 RepID=UPI001B3396B7|nr:hypothetical protein [Lactiplantibacillus argentoratensis]MBP5810052.1 hypothetical protein [Lactiplantibacillus argentoratensis]